MKLVTSKNTNKVKATDAYFETTAITNPSFLVDLIEGGQLTPWSESFAVEALGSVENRAKVFPLLTRKLSDPEGIIREGAILGIARHLPDLRRARLLLEKAAKTEQLEALVELIEYKLEGREDENDDNCDVN